MHQHHSGPHGHHHHGHEREKHGQDHDPVKPSAPLSSREKLILRIRHSIRHNTEHGGSYESMAREAEELGGSEAGRLILSAGDLTARQNEHLEKALSLLKGDD